MGFTGGGMGYKNVVARQQEQPSFSSMMFQFIFPFDGDISASHVWFPEGYAIVLIPSDRRPDQTPETITR